MGPLLEMVLCWVAIRISIVYLTIQVDEPYQSDVRRKLLTFKGVFIVDRCRVLRLHIHPRIIGTRSVFDWVVRCGVVRLRVHLMIAMIVRLIGLWMWIGIRITLIHWMRNGWRGVMIIIHLEVVKTGVIRWYIGDLWGWSVKSKRFAGSHMWSWLLHGSWEVCSRWPVVVLWRHWGTLVRRWIIHGICIERKHRLLRR